MSADRKVPRRPQPGLAFSFVCDLGFAVGLMTHEVPKMGSLTWIAEPTFENVPTVEDVRTIARWRWPVFFPVGAAIRQNIAVPIGVVAIPDGLQSFPPLRSGNKKSGWQLVELPRNSLPSRVLGPATDPSVPIYQVVNDTMLKEMVVSGWRPEDDW
jgi:hypothetical protein